MNKRPLTRIYNGTIMVNNRASLGQQRLTSVLEAAIVVMS